MKNLDTTQRVQFDLITPELGTFTITGDYDTLQPMYDDLQSEIKTDRPITPQLVQNAGKTAVRVLGDVLQPLATGLGTELKVTVYDLAHGTNFKQALREQRALRRDTVFAHELGLVALEPCKKHRRAMDTVRAIR
jgi:hypothetical protein